MLKCEKCESTTEIIIERDSLGFKTRVLCYGCLKEEGENKYIEERENYDL